MNPAPPPSAALQSLLEHQTRQSAEQLPPLGAEAMRGQLDDFVLWCVQREFGRFWDDKEQALWARLSGLLVDSALAQPRVALLPQAGADATVLAGPITWDIAALLRDGGAREDESEELDLAVRWWEGARRAGLPVPADFGECWRALEWLALQRQLVLLGQVCRQRQEGDGAADAAHTARVATLLAAASKVALRYGPLKPLLRLLPAVQGAAVGAGYTF